MKLSLLLFTTLVVFSCSPKTAPLTLADLPISIPTKGNSWVEGIDSRQDRTILQNGLSEWNKLGTTARTYFYIGKTGTLNIGINARSNVEKGQLKVTFGSKTKNIEVSKNDFELVSIGSGRKETEESRWRWCLESRPGRDPTPFSWQKERPAWRLAEAPQVFPGGRHPPCPAKNVLRHPDSVGTNICDLSSSLSTALISEKALFGITSEYVSSSTLKSCAGLITYCKTRLNIRPKASSRPNP